eukprot:CAMPEP_0198281886 /NCGR_PEP_ID=MMETSP1449-20131203/1763_1 /TAXON_ID=420275 /ORGANISM="Attheya septentrionalis, Strain CCMP2084" /LENGTH=539 /DNA_ID=CAMNT_0043977879 /DNA_START=118 /DNA_END=1737 /DNA_ORIENTATION=+
MSASFASLPSSLVTEHILTRVEASDVLSFRVASRDCFSLVHHNHHDPITTQTVPGERSHPSTNDWRSDSELLWHNFLVRDFFFPTTDEEKMYLRTFRHPEHDNDNEEEQEEEGSRSFLTVQDEFVASTAFESWKHWKKLGLRYRNGVPIRQILPSTLMVAPYFLRAAAVWRSLEQWGSEQGSVGERILASLQPGQGLQGRDVGRMIHCFLDPSHINHVKIQAALAIYAFHAGQKALGEDRFIGLMGGYSAYDYSACTTLTGLPRYAGGHQSHSLLVAQSRDSDGIMTKSILMNVHTGQLYVTPGLRSMSSGSSPFPVTPLSVQGSQEDSFLVWLEEYASRLQHGIYGIGPIVPSAPAGTTDGIVLFPTIQDEVRTSRAVTRGVQVIASSQVCTELQDDASGMVLYSFRIRLLIPGDEGYLTPAERGFETCQLIARHWKITTQKKNEVSTEHVRGEGVVGLYPLLSEGGFRNDEGHRASSLVRGTMHLGTFVYQSLTNGRQGTMEGELRFIPGSIAEPTGPPFDVIVNPFPFNNHEAYIY